ncbi:MAG: response regulator, partial [Chloroflexi bacterium]|nr:response regulator [Chloroflexota bacterium]
MTDRVLIVDDDEGVATLCQRLLRRAGFEVQSAAHPREALRLLHESRFDLMLLDIRLPEMDGFTLLRLARERDPELAIVIVTGHGTVDTAVAALQHGAEGLVL